MTEPAQWEYRAKTIGRFWGTKDEDIGAALNEWGDEGWEVFVVYTPEGSGKVTMVAKRPLTESVRRRRSMPGMMR
jgi:hypothetical protein